MSDCWDRIFRPYLGERERERERERESGRGPLFFGLMDERGKERLNSEDAQMT